MTTALRVCAPLFVGLAILGAVRNYSAVPFWDMWHGYLDFYMRIREGQWAEWWALHNEHRIVLSRILFWMDLAWFDGTVWFLIAVNYLLAFAAFLTFRAILRDHAGPLAHTQAVSLTGLFILACLFSWVQYENLVWGFQSQFFLAQWLPLLAFYFLYKAAIPQPAANRWFLLACTAGVLCIGTMASGVMALPLMVAYAITQRMGWRRIGVLVLLTAACLAAYFIDYRSTQGHGSLRDILAHRPVKLFQYLLLYLGSPFYYLFGRRSLALGQLFGLVFVLLSAAKALQYLRAPNQHPLESSLLLYIAYIGGTALGTGVGRLLFGLQQATASRYTTPALMGWMALLILFLPWLIERIPAWPHRIFWPTVVLLLVLLTQQINAGHSERPMLFERDLAALALEMGISDDAQVRKVFFNTEYGLNIARKAADADLSVFGHARLKDAGKLVNRPAGALPAAPCRAVLTGLSAIQNEPRYSRISGWIAPAEGANHISSVRLVNAQGIVVGYALAGERVKRPEPDVGQGRDSRLMKGYVLAEFAGPDVRLAATGTDCSVQIAYPSRLAFRFAGASPAAINVGPAAVISNEGWRGTDFARTSIAGFKVLGSYVQSDAETGTLALRLRRGAILYYRSGPWPENQRFLIDDGQRYAGQLPRCEMWTALVFDDTLLPDEFILTLIDGGTGWGEWAAIAIKDAP